MAARPAHSFHFLFRTDRGHIDRATWRRGALPLLALVLAATFGWLALRPYAFHDLGNTPFLDLPTACAFLYLIVYAFGLILAAVCGYNLGAKRFRDRGRPAPLAGILPGAAFVAGALIWFIPRSFGAVPDWAAPLAIGAVLGVAIWNVVELGFGAGRRP